MGAFDIQAATRPLELDSNYPLKMYLRTARTVLRQAEVYRGEGNKVQLYILLLRLISLVLETIPRHRDAKNGMFAQERQFLTKCAHAAFVEAEQLKPEVELMNKLGTLRLDEPFPEEDDNVVPSYFPTSPARSAALASVGMLHSAPLLTNGPDTSLDEWARSIAAPTSVQQQSYGTVAANLTPPPLGSYSSNQAGIPFTIPSLSLSTPLPSVSAEALSRHSFFSFSPASATTHSSATAGPLQISYPALDQTPVSMPDLLGSWQSPGNKAASPGSAGPSGAASASESATPSSLGPTVASQAPGGEKEMIQVLLPAAQAQAGEGALAGEGAAGMAAAAAAVAAAPAASPAPRMQPAPPPVSAEVHHVPRDGPLPQPPPCHANGHAHAQRQPHPRAVADPRPGKAMTKVGAGTISKPGGVKAVHISPKMMEEFMRMVQNNTRRNLETCGILAGNLKKGMFYVTTLILPKQQATSDSCSTLNEEEIFEVQDKKGLFQVGWIHTHPSQACFMSSIDLHTHYSYQVMLPEAIAIVMAPSDSSRQSGIFRLSDPGGMKVVAGCRQRGFHPHEAPADGSPIYIHSSHVFYNPKINFEVIDIRST